MNKNFFSDMLIRKPKLIHALIDFNTHEERVTSRQNWKKIFEKTNTKSDEQENTRETENFLRNTQPLVENLLQDPSIRSILKRKALNNANFASTVEKIKENKAHMPTLFWDFADNSRKIALISAKDSLKLILYLGASINAQEIAHCIVKNDVQKIRNSLGKEVYAYALNRGQYTLTSIKNVFTSLFPKQSLYHRIVLQGAVAHLIICHSWPQELQETFRPILQNALEELLANSLTPKSHAEKKYTAETFTADTYVNDTYVNNTYTEKQNAPSQQEIPINEQDTKNTKNTQNTENIDLETILNSLNKHAKTITTPDMIRHLKFHMHKILINEVQSIWAQYLD